jgi:hypothetical protein
MIHRPLCCALLSVLLSVASPATTFAQAAAVHAKASPPSPGLRKSSPHLAFADATDPNPGSGRALILTGWIALGVAVLSGAQGPLCSLNSYDTRAGQRSCVRFSLGVGIAALTLGVPSLVLGYRRRSAQNQWKKRHGLSALTMGMSLSTAQSGFLLGLQLTDL